MSVLSTLPEDDILKIISLPYKAAIWVSHADDVDGETDDIKEMNAIERGIPQLAKMYENSDLVQIVSDEIIRHKDRWSQWEDECFHIIGQAPEIMTLILDGYGRDEAKQYRGFVMALSKMVAQAASEFEAFDVIEEEKESFFGGLIDKITSGMAAIGQDDAGHPANISAAEKGALSQLSKALQIPDSEP